MPLTVKSSSSIATGFPRIVLDARLSIDRLTEQAGSWTLIDYPNWVSTNQCPSTFDLLVSGGARPATPVSAMFGCDHVAGSPAESGSGDGVDRATMSSRLERRSNR